MAGYQFDELTKDLAAAKSRRGFLKGLLGAGLAAAGVGTILSGVASASGGSCQTAADCVPGPCETNNCTCTHKPGGGKGFGTGTCTCAPVVCAKKTETCCPSTGVCQSGRCR